MSRTTSTRLQTISEQMQEMGEFILLVAQDTASRQGIDAQGVVRHGDISEEIVALCHELAADYVVLGPPRLEHEGSVFTQELLVGFIKIAEEQTGAKVVLSDGGSR